jgi:hypothetical protein
VLVETVAAETVKTVAFASLLGVLVLVLALHKADILDQIPAKFNERTIRTVEGVADEDSFGASSSFSSVFEAVSEVTEAFSSAVFLCCYVYQKSPHVAQEIERTFLLKRPRAAMGSAAGASYAIIQI